MKNSKRYFALMLSLVITASECVPAMADELLDGSNDLIAIEETNENQDVIIKEETADDILANEESDLEDDALIVDSHAELEDIQITEDITAEYETIVSGNEATTSANTVADKDALEAASFFSCLDSVSELSAEEMADKLSLAEHANEWRNAVADVDFASNEIIVEAADQAEAEEYALAYNGRLAAYECGVALIELNEVEGAPEASVLDAVKASADVNVALPAAWPNYYMEFYGLDENEEVLEDNMPVSTEIDNIDTAAAGYSDPFLSSGSSYYQYQHALHQSASSWSRGFKGKGIKVVVIDSGVNGAHEDIKMTGVVVFDSKTNKYVSASSTTNTDIVGHGTHCTGIIGETLNNGKGGAGIAPEASLYMARCAIASGSGYSIPTYACIQGVNYAASIGADVVSMSFGSKAYVDAFNTACNNAYNKGVALFASSGNDGSSVLNYPACYDSVNSVGAVDSSNTQASFSNKNDKVKYTGSGVYIWATGYESSTSYVRKSGTSMACPSIAGVAADILSSKCVSGTGKQRVNNLLSIMDSSAVSSGTGGGKGTVKLGTAVTQLNNINAPGSPVATISVKQPIEATSVRIMITTDPGTDIYFTTDGSAPNINSPVIVNSSGEEVLGLNASYDNKLKIKLMAVNRSNGLKSKVSSYTYTFAPLVRRIGFITSNGTYNKVVKGTSISLKAVVNKDAAKKNVKWELVGTPDKVTLSSSGKLTVNKDSAATTITVKAIAQDKGACTSNFTLYVVDPASIIPIVSLTASNKTPKMYVGKKDTFTVAVKKKDGSTANASSLTWSSSDTDTAMVSVNSDGVVTVTGYAKGSATITGAASDGSGKKIDVRVSVLQQVTGVYITGPNDVSNAVISKGKSFTFKTTDVYPSSANNKKFVWEIVGVPVGTSVEACGVTVNKTSGKVSASKTAVAGTYTVKATAADGQGYSRNKSFVVTDTSITKIEIPTNKYRIYRNTSRLTIPVTIAGGTLTSGVSMSVSNKNLLDEYSLTNSGIVITPSGVGTGSVKITLKSEDGSNKKATCTVTIANAPTKVMLLAPENRSAYIAAGKTLKLTPKFIEGNGPIDSEARKLTWTSSDTSVLTVDNKGVVKNITKDGSSTPVNITATSADGVVGVYRLYGSGTVKSVSCSYDVSKSSFVVVQKGTGVLTNDYVASLNRTDFDVTMDSTSRTESAGEVTLTTYFSVNANSSSKTARNVKLTVKKTDGSGKKCSASHKFVY